MRNESLHNLLSALVVCVALAGLAPGAESFEHREQRRLAECEEGNTESCIEQGFQDEYGFGPMQDLNRAVALYERACELGNPDGCLRIRMLAKRFEGGDSVLTRDLNRAAALAERSCELDSDTCGYLGRLGLQHVEGDDVPLALDRAVAITSRACELDDGACAFLDRLARMLLSGERVPRDPELAEELGRRACVPGADCLALDEVARTYDEGTSLPRDVDRAIALYREVCAADGWCFGLHLSARRFRNGEGVERDLDRARELYEAACAGGNEDACADVSTLDDPSGVDGTDLDD